MSGRAHHGGVWEIEFYEDDRGREPCREWMEKLSDVQHDALVAALEVVLATRGLDACETQWARALGGGLYEFRVRHTADEVRRMFAGSDAEGTDEGEAVLLRAFFTAYGNRVILLLGGYDKGSDPSKRKQEREIATARNRLLDFKDAQAAKKRAAKKAAPAKRAPKRGGGRGR